MEIENWKLNKVKFLKTFTISIFLAFRSLRNNLARTFLSLLGIVIGVIAVTLVFSLGAGLKGFVLGQVESFGSDLIQIEVKVPKTKHASAENAGGIVSGIQITTMKLDELEELSKIPDLGDWYGGLMGQETISYRGENETIMIFGTTAGVIDVDEQMKVAKGVMYSEADDRSLKQVITLGSKIKKELFADEDAIGKKVKLGDSTFRVVAVLEERGSTGFSDFDNLVYIPARTLQKKMMGIDHVQFGLFKIEDANKVELIETRMNQKMRDLHDIDDPEDDDFGVMSIAEATDMIDSVFKIINILLLALTSISLVVGGVGIMNVMYVAVTERTSEIGLRKALGAKNRDIMWQFLFEAVFITLLGGVIGVILGVILSKVAEYVIAQYNFFLTFPLTIGAVAVSLGFSMLTGVIFGIKPAWNASKLSPMEALNKQ